MQHEQVIIQREHPEWFWTLPEDAMNVDELVRAVLRYMRTADVTEQDVLAVLEQPITWSLPAAYGTVEGKEQIVTLPYTDDFEALRRLHIQLFLRVYHEGWAYGMEQEINSVFKGRAASRWMFTPSEPGDYAAELFSAEFALRLSPRKSRLVFQGDTCVRRFRHGKFWSEPIGLNGIRQEVQYMAQIRGQLTSPGPKVKYAGFDILDKAAIAIARGKHALGLEGARRALQMLKMQRGHDATYKLAYALQYLHDFKMDVERTEHLRNFNPEKLDEIRDLWFDRTKPDYEVVQGLYKLVVPAYFDHEGWLRIFRTELPEEEALTDKHIKKLDSGMERFSNWFLKQRR